MSGNCVFVQIRGITGVELDLLRVNGTQTRSSEFSNADHQPP